MEIGTIIGRLNDVKYDYEVKVEEYNNEMQNEAKLDLEAIIEAIDLLEELRSNEEEQAYSRHIENFYGGSSPMTLKEQQEVNKKVK